MESRDKLIYIHNVKMLDEKGCLKPMELLVEDDKIKIISEKITLPSERQDLHSIDGKGAFLSPGLIDLHVHLRQPGGEAKETIASGTQAAARGGYTQICAMPNLKPVPDTAERFDQQMKLNREEALIQVHQYAPITKDLISETELVDFETLSEKGALAFTNDGVGVQTAGTMLKAMQRAAQINKPLVAHTEDNSLVEGGVIHRGKRAEELALPGIYSAAESVQIARDCLLAKEAGCHYHVCHVSTKESVAVIRAAKATGVNVTCEVCPHHLILNDSDIPEDDGNWKMNPPLRAEDDRQALIEGLLDGTIDCIATDHAPHTLAEKNQSMLKAPFGITGSETAFALIYTHFVRTGLFSLAQVIDWMSTKPARLFNLGANQLQEGAPADLVLFDLDHEFEIKAADFLSLSSNTPFLGERVFGQTELTLFRGKIVYQSSL